MKTSLCCNLLQLKYMRPFKNRKCRIWNSFETFPRFLKKREKRCRVKYVILSPKKRGTLWKKCHHVVQWMEEIIQLLGHLPQQGRKYCVSAAFSVHQYSYCRVGNMGTWAMVPIHVYPYLRLVTGSNNNLLFLQLWVSAACTECNLYHRNLLI